MSEADRVTKGANALYHPVSHYGSPDEVLRDEMLSVVEKRLVLSSWASDMYAVEENPALRAIPGVPEPMRLHDILAALRRLDEQNDPPPRGGAAMRLVQPVSLNAVARRTAVAPARQPRMWGASSIRPGCWSEPRWSREANIQRYRRLLRTELSERERQYIERRLAEELQADGRRPPAVNVAAQ